MSTLLGVRPLSRSATIGIGAKDVKPGKVTYVNIENSRVIRDVSRHTSIGQVLAVANPRYQRDTAQVASGGLVTPRAASLTLDVSSATLSYVQGNDAVYTKGVLATVAAGTQAVTANATTPQVVAIGYDTSTPATPALVALAGTAAATVLESRFTNAYVTLPGNPATDTTADRTWLAAVWVPPALAVTGSVFGTGVITIGSAHGYVVGDTVWFSALTGGTGLSTATQYTVATVPSSTTFTLSTPHTANITAATIQRQILAADVLDIRP